MKKPMCQKKNKATTTYTNRCHQLSLTLGNTVFFFLFKKVTNTVYAILILEMGVMGWLRD